MNEPNLGSRERILHKALEKFSTLGFKPASMDDIAAELKMSKKTVYKFFPTKFRLAEALVEHKMAEINRRSDAILASPLPAIEKLFRILQMIVEQQHRFITKTLLQSMQNELPQLWKRMDEFRLERMRKNMQSILAQGKEEGTVNPGIDRDLFMQFLLGAIREGLSPEVLVNASYSLQEALVMLLNIFLKGVLTDVGRKQYQQLVDANPMMSPS